MFNGPFSNIKSQKSEGWMLCKDYEYTHTHTHTHLMALCPGLPGWADTRKVKPIWILLKQETVSGSGIRCAICKSAPRSRQITMPAPHCSVFYRPDALPAAQPTVSKHWRQKRLWIYFMEKPQDKKGHKTTYTCPYNPYNYVNRQKINIWTQICNTETA